MSGLKFILEMVDKMSAPAGAAARSVERLEKALAGTAGLKMPSLKMPSAAGAATGRSGKPGKDPLAAIDKEWSNIAAAEEKGRLKQLAVAEKVLARQRALEEKSRVQAATAEEKGRLKQALQATKEAAKAQPHQDAAMLPVLAGMPKLQLVHGQLDQLKQSLRDDKLAVTNLTASLRQLEAATVVDIGAVRLLRAEIQQKKNALAETQKTLVLSGNAAKFGSEGTNRLTTTLRELANAAGLGGIRTLAPRLAALADAAGGFHNLGGAVKTAGAALSETTGLSGPAAIGIAAVGAAAVAATVAVLALGAGMAVLAVKGAELAIEAGDAKGDTLDMLEAMLGTADAAHETYDAITDLTRDTTLTIGRGQELAQSLATAGLTNVALMKDALSSIAVVDSVIRGGGEKLQGIIEKATTAGHFDVNAKKLVGTGVQVQALYEEISARTGIGIAGMEKTLKAGKVSAEVGVAALTAVIDKKLGAVARKQAHDLPAQMARLKGNIGRLFEDVNTGPFLEALSKIVDLFDESSRSGRILKGVFTDMYDGLFKVATKTIDYVETLMLGMLVTGLEVAVGLEPLLIQLGLVGDVSESSETGMDLMVDGLLMIGKAAGNVASALSWIGTTPALFYTLGAAVAIVTAPFWLLPAALFGLAAAWTYVAATFNEGWETLKNVFGEAIYFGGLLVDGLVEGIVGAAGKLINAVSGLAKSAVDAFKNIWQMRSPSKIGLGLGLNLGTSVSTGIKRAQKPANDNMSRLIGLPAAGSAPQGGMTAAAPEMRGSASGSRGGKSVVVNVTFAPGAIVIQGGGSPAAALESARGGLVELMAGVMEEAALKAGLDPTGTG